MAIPPLVTVVETPEFIARTDKLMSSEDRDELIGYLSRNPTAGDVVSGAGGIRKLRWRLAGRGKRGGARIIYFFHNVDVPLFALTAFAKNDRVDFPRKSATNSDNSPSFW